MRRFGPYPQTQVDHIREVLGLNGIPFEIEWNEQLIHRARQADQREITTKPTFTGLDDVAYFIVDDESLAHLPAELEKYAFVDSPEGNELEGEDYLCPQCEHHSLQPGFCPDHRIRLLDYSSYLQRQRDRQKLGSKIWRTVLLMFIILAGLAYVYSTLHLKWWNPTQLWHW